MNKSCSTCKNKEKCTFYHVLPDIAVYYAKDCDEWEPI